MPLIFTEKVKPASFGSLFEAKDANSAVVVVVFINIDVLQDIGIDDALRMAERKYDLGLIEEDGSVLVRPSDFDPKRSLE